MIFLRSITTKVWVPKAVLVSEEHGVDLSLNLDFQNSNQKASFKEVLIGTKRPILSGANLVPLGPARDSLQHTGGQECILKSARICCSRYLSHLHGRWACPNRVRCNSCFRLGHISSFCRFPPRFPGLSKCPSFCNEININSWDKDLVKSWFRCPVRLTNGISERLRIISTGVYKHQTCLTLLLIWT